MKHIRPETRTCEARGYRCCETDPLPVDADATRYALHALMGELLQRGYNVRVEDTGGGALAIVATVGDGFEITLGAETVGVDPITADAPGHDPVAWRGDRGPVFAWEPGVRLGDPSDVDAAQGLIAYLSEASR